MVFSGMLRRVALVRTHVSEEPGATFIRVTRIGELGTTQDSTILGISSQRTFPAYLSYKVNGVIAEHNHNILQLLPYRPELNPVELTWAIVKNFVAQNNTTFRMDDVIKLADQKLAT
jgi:hypothetical protein